MINNFQQIAGTVYPDAKLIDYKKLEGGVSAQVYALEVALPDDSVQKMVVRQYGAADLNADPHIAAHEFALLRILQERGLPTPEPYYVDESCKILPSPYIVVEFIDGQVVDEPTDAVNFAWQMADVLAKIHQIDAGAELTFLPDQQQAFTKKLALRPAQLDDSLSEGRIRDALAVHWPPKQQNKSVLLHGDFWPGNTMWKDGKLAGVIDWEDAATGDPLADLGNGKLEILMLLGPEAMEAFTARYTLLMSHLNYDNLPYWELCASLRPAGKMADWGLDDATLHRLQIGHKQFVDQAIAKISLLPTERV